MQHPTIVPFQPPLPYRMPVVRGNADYNQYRTQILLIEKLLVQSGVEKRLIEADLRKWSAGAKYLSPRAQQRRQIECRRALRCIIVLILLRENYRGLAARLADSPLLQQFCGLIEVDRIQVPSKSTLHRYANWWDQEQIRQMVTELLRQGAEDPASLGLAEPIDLDTVFLDSTCVEADIHYPIDWVLMRDAVRTLTKAVELIRGQGLKHRMEQPQLFLKRMNNLCIQMTHAGKKPDSQRQRKRILRKIDKLVGVVRAHARRHRDLLDKHWEKTQWTRPQAELVLRRIDSVLEQLPKARQQARQRILAGELVPSCDKILSLYDKDVRVIVRNKASAEVEFGNSLLLGENLQGLIIDWKLFRESAPADSVLLPQSIGRMESVYGRKVKAVGADRGFDSRANQLGLEWDGIYNGVCPRSPFQMRIRCRSWKFRWIQRRRSQTEGRIGIFKNGFLDQPVRWKGFEGRELRVSWSVLVHNLWVLARLVQAQAEQKQSAAA
jgi:IS5 family transposase